jgi:hypothetical protein
MSERTEKAFDEIAGETIQRAARVPCSITDYLAGLRHIIEELNVAVEAAQRDLEHEAEDGF